MNFPESLPERFARIVGELGEPGTVTDTSEGPYETVTPIRSGFIDRDGVPIWYAQWGEKGPCVAFAPPFQMVHSGLLKAVVPYLSQHLRVITMDPRGNGRSGRPLGQAAYSFDLFYGDFLGVLDALAIEKLAVVGISLGTLLMLRLAAEQPERVTHVIAAGGFADTLLELEEVIQKAKSDTELLQRDWPGFIDNFVAQIITEEHSTKQFEDTARFGWATSATTMYWVREAWFNQDLRDCARRIKCPALVIHGDDDHRVVYGRGLILHGLIPNARLLTVEGGGHVPAARDPVVFNREVLAFIAGPDAKRTWTRAMKRKRRALFISSPIGLGHVQRDLAIARELRKLQPDLLIDWFTVDPAASYLMREGERLHPITARLANESQHFEAMAGEHDLHAFFALRTMDEIMTHNFMTFLDLVSAEHYDLIIGDEAWDVDFYYHENPELKRQPFVFLTDFVGCLPMNHDDAREVHLCADRNADELEHIARYPYIRDASIFIGNPEDVTEAPFGPGLPQIREWTDRNFEYSGYCLPFDPKGLADTEALRARHGFGRAEKVAIATVGGTAAGRFLLERIIDALPQMRREVPELRLIAVTGPRLPPSALPSVPGLEVRSYVHNLFEQLACCDLALVQGGLSTTMELVATRRPFLSFPLRRHFEQCIHVRRRLENYGADRSYLDASFAPDLLAQRALEAMHAPVTYQPVETDGASRAARRIAEVLENRHWIR